MMLKTLIVDDEPLARRELRAMLDEDPDFVIVAEAANVEAACKAVVEHQPDVMFLDIALRGENGFDVLQRLTLSPEVVFVTAFDDYALQAFDANALDYLVKPVRRERFEKALERLKQRIIPTPQLNVPQHEERQSIFIQDGKRCYFVRLQDIFLIERADDYAQIWFGNGYALVHQSLATLEKKLPPAMFFRANRQEMVNCNFITDIERTDRSSLEVVVQDATSGFTRRVSISERRSVAFKEQMKL
jgi:two-component system, LytTR family, response regulator